MRQKLDKTERMHILEFMLTKFGEMGFELIQRAVDFVETGESDKSSKAKRLLRDARSVVNLIELERQKNETERLHKEAGKLTQEVERIKDSIHFYIIILSFLILGTVLWIIFR